MDNYTALKIQAKELADKLPSIQTDTPQHILWLKMAICEKIDSRKSKNDKVFTFTDADGKFGFSEQYVNQIISYAYEKGRVDAYESATKAAAIYKEAFEKIKEIVSD